MDWIIKAAYICEVLTIYIPGAELSLVRIILLDPFTSRLSPSYKEKH